MCLHHKSASLCVEKLSLIRNALRSTMQVAECKTFFIDCTKKDAFELKLTYVRTFKKKLS